MADDATKRAAEDLVEALAPLDARAKAMFGGYCFYVDEKVGGLVCDGRVFVKGSSRDALFEGYAELAPAYPGAKDTWRLAADAVASDPDRVRDLIEQVVASLPAPRKKR